MNYEALETLVVANLGTLFFALCGSFILTVISIKEHIDRDIKDKMSNGKYVMYLLGWAIGFPLLGVVVAVAYLASGNQFGTWLALQIGLTSPAIVAGIASSGANSMSEKGIETAADQ
jgi:hypothetical protein